MNWSRLIGISLVVLSLIFYGLIPLLPFFPLTASQKIAAIPALAVFGESAFWIGGVLLGKEVVSRYRQYLNPRKWFVKSKEENSNDS